MELSLPKKLITLFLASSALTLSAQEDVVTNVQVGDLYYCLNKSTMEACVVHNSDYLSYTMVDIPASVTFDAAEYVVKSVAHSAFEGCENLQSVTFPETLVNISGKAFKDCKKLKEVKSPESLATIGDSIFMGCESLQSAFFYGTVIEILPSYGFYDCKSLKYIGIPSSIKDILKKCFEKSGLETIRFEYLENVRERAFADCVNLKSVYFKYWGEMEPSVFSGCSSLTEVYLPEQLKKVPSNTFENCVSLKNVRIPADVQSIAEDAFGTGNVNIESYIVDCANPPVLESASSLSISENTKIYVPAAYVDVYKNDSSWSRLGCEILSQEDYKFYYEYAGIQYLLNYVDKTVVLYRVKHLNPDKILRIEEGIQVPMFNSRCDISAIDDSAFDEVMPEVICICPDTKVKIAVSENLFPDKNIPVYVYGDELIEYFKQQPGWSSLTNYKLGEETMVMANIDNLMYFAIMCEGLAVVIPDDSYESLEVIRIPETITIDDVLYNVTGFADEDCFSSAVNLKAVYIYDSNGNLSLESPIISDTNIPVYVQNDAYDNGYYMKHYKWRPLNLRRASDAVFNHNDGTFNYSLDTFNLNAKVTGLTSTEEIVEMTETVEYNSELIPVKTIGEKAFYGIADLKSVNTNNVEIIENSAFADCDNLEFVTFGPNTIKIGDEVITSNSLRKIQTFADVPPMCENNSFIGVDKGACELDVPENSVDAYSNAPVWQDFYKISNSEMIEDDEVGDINAETEVKVYAVSGVLVYQGKYGELPTLSKGFYIVNSSTNTIKIAL